MNNKDNILKSWIMVELLSEGNINVKEKSLKYLDKKILNNKSINNFFIDFINNNIINKNDYKIKNKEKNSKVNPGLVFYIDIFDFENVLESLRSKFKFDEIFEKSKSGKKFGIACYFDKDLKFISDNLFVSASYYMYKKNEVPTVEELEEFQDSLTKKFETWFEEDFNMGFEKLKEEFLIDENNFVYKFIKNLEKGEINLHSFFIKDLRKAQYLNTNNLTRYLEGFDYNKRISLNTNTKNMSSEEQQIIEEILQPKNYPLGRFPSNSEHALSLMQQVAVNLYFKEDSDNYIKSVNGPPGTGKTTLLKDIFSELIVKQAKSIVDTKGDKLSNSISYAYKKNELEKKAEFFSLPNKISNYNIVVASSNNGAVQNIVNELPLLKEISDEFKDEILNVDYFKDECSNKLEVWGAFALEGGKKTNIDNIFEVVQKIFDKLNDKGETYNIGIYEEFQTLYNKLEKIRESIQEYYEIYKELEQEKTKNYKIKNFSKQLLEEEIENINKDIEKYKNLRQQCEKNYEILKLKKSKFFWLQKLFFKSKVKAYLNSLEKINEEINNNQRIIDEFNNQKNYISGLIEKIDKLSTLENHIKLLLDKNIKIEKIDFNLNYRDFQLSTPWFNKEYRVLQSKLFILAMKVRKAFLYRNRYNLIKSKIIWANQNYYIEKDYGLELIKEAWQWINFAIPVISTTFASFGRMFKNMGINSISNLFVDEAGQALPQAGVGAIFRSKNILVVGDPAQIKPVLPLESGVLGLISNKYNVDEKYLFKNSSIQTLVDSSSKYGFYKNQKDWIGIPLWVHRRCNHPMFDISNAISYNNLMVQGVDNAIGKAEWFDVKGAANDKYVQEQAKFLKKEIQKKYNNNNNNNLHRKDIYVITPFKNVAVKLSEFLAEGDFFTRKDSKNAPINVGTVHTFQGKEAKVVYLVLGADKNSVGAARWAVSEPNIINVAATRSKKEFYIIGDKELYENMVFSKISYEIIEKYNKISKK